MPAGAFDILQMKSEICGISVDSVDELSIKVGFLISMKETKNMNLLLTAVRQSKAMTRAEYRAYVQHIGPMECRKWGKAVDEMKTDWDWKKKCNACTDAMRAVAAKKKTTAKKSGIKSKNDNLRAPLSAGSLFVLSL